jgi:hypothetical protein
MALKLEPGLMAVPWMATLLKRTDSMSRSLLWPPTSASVPSAPTALLDDAEPDATSVLAPDAAAAEAAAVRPDAAPSVAKPSRYACRMRASRLEVMLVTTLPTNTVLASFSGSC